MSRECVIAYVQTDVAEEFRPGLHAMTRFATSPNRPQGRFARSLKNVSPPSVDLATHDDVAIGDAVLEELGRSPRDVGRVVTDRHRQE